ncbi:hypothetical protein SmJEL517_g03290 [Synchytrium microbalum]|uniref:MI domain-containing protein n=1 Tax=Synchytrium microbalum TaxID=1806994 RepID=A0A507C7D6_9FUNG|nr:uncharacterized protein SmJEL517_g03290 [Synchytrium microbalum]TPX33906.1 hypothetical protein SmJEL517_g03290 [Synchytrium microbalum]
MKRPIEDRLTGPRMPSVLLDQLASATTNPSERKFTKKHQKPVHRKDKRRLEKLEKKKRVDAFHSRKAVKLPDEVSTTALFTFDGDHCCPKPVKHNPLKRSYNEDAQISKMVKLDQPQTPQPQQQRQPQIHKPVPPPQKKITAADVTRFATKNPNIYKLLVADGLTKSLPPPTEPTTVKMGQEAFEQDGYEIAYYAKKLGIKKKKGRYSKELELDGLDDLLEGLGADGVATDTAIDSKAATIDDSDSDLDLELFNGEEEDVDQDMEEEDHDEEEDSDNDMDHLDSDDELIGEEEELDPAEEDDDEEVDEAIADEHGSSSSSDNELDDKDNADQSSSLSATKYVPPHLRQQPKGEQYERLRKQLQGLINRLSDSNLESIFMGVESCFQNYPRHDVTEILTTLLIASVAEKIHLLDSFVCNYAALISAIYSLVGGDIGAQMLQSTVELFLKARSTNSLDDATASRQASNLAALLAFLYNFQVVACVLIYDLVRECIAGLSETDVEVLLKLLRLSGSQLRSDDPQSLKDIVAAVQSEASKRDMTSSRLKFLVESILDLKNNRKRKTGGGNVDVLVEQQERVKKMVGGIIMKRHGHGHEALRCSLDEIKSVNERGRWWVVGAAWAGRQQTQDQVPSSSAQPDNNNSNHHTTTTTSNNNMSGLLELARKQGMNTEIRRNVFVALMSSEDCTDALSRLESLKLTPPRDREAVRVLVHCCTREKAFNPYYALVAQRLVDRNFSMKVTLQYVLWDALKSLEEGEVRKTVHLARLYAYLIGKGAMSLHILKILNFASLSPAQQIFLTALFENLLKMPKEGSSKKDLLPKTLADGVKDEVVREGLALFLTTFDSQNDALVEKRVNLLRQYLLQEEQ